MKIIFENYHRAFILISVLTILSVHSGVSAQTLSSSRVEVSIVTDEAEEVFEISKKKENDSEMTDADRQNVFFGRRLHAA